jgi:hypothetical protein
MTAPEWELIDLVDNPEHDLYDSHICELTDIAGFPIKYFVRTSTNTEDTLYGEDQNESFSEGYETKIIYSPEEETSIIDVFGFTPEDIIQYCFIPKNNFIRDISDLYLTDYMPMIGDVIITLWNNRRYEITNISDTQNIFQGKKYVWEFVLKPHKYSEESDSEEEIVNFDPEDDFPDINDPGFETKELSGFGDNDIIDEEAENISIDSDSNIYGY